jgi:hypothetical protein
MGAAEDNLMELDMTCDKCGIHMSHQGYLKGDDWLCTACYMAIMQREMFWEAIKDDEEDRRGDFR